MKRCFWCQGNKLYEDYHDKEWGKLVADDEKLFEFLTLESAQAGLSWITILKRREGYRKAFCNFDVAKVAKMTEKDVERLMQDDTIIKNRLKIKAAIKNAKHFMEVQKEFGSFYNYLIGFFPNKKPITNSIKKKEDIKPTDKISDSISKDMKKRGFTFFGSTICYAHLQATGFINDHFDDCSFK